MKAIPGHIFAQIQAWQDGLLHCHFIFTDKELPEWNNNTAPAIDVTAFVPQPKVGDIFNPATQTFSPQPAPVAPPPDTVTPALKTALTNAIDDATVPANLKAVLTALRDKLTP